MKRLSIIFLGILTILTVACNNKQTQKTTTALKSIDTLMMEQDTVNERIKAIMDALTFIISKEALQDTTILNTLAETRNVIYQISKQNYEQAQKDLKILIGELEVSLTKNPDASLVPVAVYYQKFETVDNIDTVRKIVSLAKKAFENGYYQSAKQILNTITSEMVINTTYLPIVAYLNGMKEAAALMDDGKYTEATALLLQSLNTVINTKVAIPLPILKAQVYIDWASSLDNKEHKDDIINLLDNAYYQITLAEEMGYGKHDVEFKELYNAINALKLSVENKEETKSKFDSLKIKIKQFRERLFPAGKNS